MKKSLILGALAASAAFATPAQAAATLVFVGGAGNLGANETNYADFQTTFGTSVLTGSGGVVSPPNVAGQYAQPATGDQGDPFYYVFSNGYVDFSFGAGVNFFGFDLGSADDYNTLTVFFAGGGSQSFAGNQLNPPFSASGNQVVPETNGRVTVFGNDQLIIGARFASGQPSFEFDNIGINAVPEPSTWALLILGFGAVGHTMRRRNTKVRIGRASLNFA